MDIRPTPTTCYYSLFRDGIRLYDAFHWGPCEGQVVSSSTGRDCAYCCEKHAVTEASFAIERNLAAYIKAMKLHAKAGIVKIVNDDILLKHPFTKNLFHKVK
jgi:hypothetical protein